MYYVGTTWIYKQSFHTNGFDRSLRQYVIVIPLSTVGYTSVASVSTVDSGITALIHDRCKL